MEDDQQFCLRWNNHQATLIAVFDKLLENETLVDCTLAAEGKYLNAHKVVLSACSPYFESLLSQNYDKHPIFILKDVKYLELKAMMDYMYRGEVNISQDSLSGLLRAAESLQIKGLSDNRGGGGSGGGGGSRASDDGPTQAKRQAQQSAKLPNKGQGLTITEQRGGPSRAVKSSAVVEPPPQMQDDRDGSVSPGPSRRRKRARRKSTDTEDNLNHHDGASNSSESHQSSNHMTTSASTTTNNKPSRSEEVPAPLIETKAELHHAIQQQKTNDQPAFASCNSNPTAPSSSTTMQLISSKQEPSTSQSASGNIISQAEVMLEPKSEYLDDMNEDSIEDLTLDDDDLSNMEDGAGPSGQGGGESNQGFGWHMNPGQDEVFMAAQEAVGAHRDSQDQDSSLTTDNTKKRRNGGSRPSKGPRREFNTPIQFIQTEDGIQYQCPTCGRVYKLRSSLRNHQKWECDKDPQFECLFCPYKAKQKMHMIRHMERMHKDNEMPMFDFMLDFNVDMENVKPIVVIEENGKVEIMKKVEEKVGKDKEVDPKEQADCIKVE